ncbi:helix-turn-helix transcriptional regulator [Weissella diestrammenae]|uniref:Helix-turn-helix transcriptional regulator n=1 Tax=Weissella diestrammenae TaxID=1162633 RepID=A0A7G9T594_9LACO|nr:AraC family transcriptional regulator [Weissella diestrammenae]MCM0583125.1 helix-turn-helix transcriptional regulator [Weissella diestrammenae]QNN75269.1 helix-turn-helix transcriptional regulator [Weissella diestrammenae]
MEQKIISIALPPFPNFIEGNLTSFQAGQMHPDRNKLGYFDLIFVKKGQLFISEAGLNYTIKQNEMFILLPDQHHYSWQACEEKTEFFWIHIYTTAQWEESNRPKHFTSMLPIPDLHFHQRNYTLHLPKQAEILDQELIFELLLQIQSSTEKTDVDAIWHTEELFLKFLKYIENEGFTKDRVTILAEKIHLYLEKNICRHLTNQDISSHFHLHINYLARVSRQIYGKTPLEVLDDLRIEVAKEYLVKSNVLLKSISTIVGYESYISFSNHFKKVTGLSPRDFREHYREKV